MAADIHAYHATRVPVGDDQRQHLELANDIAKKFNYDYGVDFFPNIEPLVLGPAARVMSLRDGPKKMSKSDPSDQSRINLNDDPDTIALKIRRAKTDPLPLPSEAAGLADRPEARNLVGIFAALADTDHATVLEQHGGKGFGPFKSTLIDLLVEKLTPIASETRRRLADEDSIVERPARRRRARRRDCRTYCRRSRAAGRTSSAAGTRIDDAPNGPAALPWNPALYGSGASVPGLDDCGAGSISAGPPRSMRNTANPRRTWPSGEKPIQPSAPTNPAGWVRAATSAPRGRQ